MFKGATAPGEKFFSLYKNRLGLFSRNVWFFLTGVFCIGLGMTFWNLLFNLYLQEAGYDKAFIGNVLALGNIAVAIAAIPAGLLTSRISLKTQIIGMQTLSALAFGIAIMMGRPPLIIAFVFTAFAFSTFVRVVGGPFVMRNSSPVERTYIFSTLFVIMLAGGVVGNALAGFLTDLLMNSGVDPIASYRYVILMGVGSSIIGVLPFFFIRTDDINTPSGAAPSLKNFRKLEWSLYIKAMIPHVLVASGAGLIVQFMNLYFKDVFNSNDQAIGIYMSAQACTMVFGIMLAPVLAERFGKVNTIVSSQLASLPFILVLAFTDNLPLAVAAFVTRSALMNMSSPIFNTLLMELSRPEEQGILNALFMMAWSISWAFSAFLYGRVLNADYTLCFIIATGLYLSSSILYYIFFRNAEKGLHSKAAAASADIIP